MLATERTSVNSVIRLAAASIGLVAQAGAGHAQQWLHGEQAGAVYTITRTVEASYTGNGGSTGSSTDRDTLMERVVAVHKDGLELEYSLPGRTGADEGTSDWQFPARFFKPTNGPLRLLNAPELETRVDRWLTKPKLPRAACGQSYFTWNVFRIECDPQSVLHLVEAWDLRLSPLSDGSSYKDLQALGPATLSRVSGDSHSGNFSGEAAIDPELVRREEAEADVTVAGISKKSLTLDDALRARSTEKIAGTIKITFEVDGAGLIRQRNRVTRIEVDKPDGTTERRVVEEPLERKPAIHR